MSHDIEYVLAIVQERSFSKAAKKLFLTQPALSRYIAALEQRLGCRLFDRSAKPLSLTREGEIYARAAERIRDIESEMGRALEESKKVDKQPLRVGITPNRAPYILSAVLPRFSALYPDAGIDVREELMYYLKQKLIDGDVDLIIGTMGRDSQADDLFLYEELPDEYLYLAAPLDMENAPTGGVTYKQICDGTAQQMPCVDFAQFEHCRFITYHPELSSSRFLPMLAADAGFKPDVRLVCRSTETALALVHSGCGCAVFYGAVIKKNYFENPPLYYRVNAAPLHVRLAYRKNKPLRFLAKEFIRILSENVNDA